MFNQRLGYWGHTSVVVFSLRRWLAVIDDASAARHTPLSVCLSLSLLFKPSNASPLAEVWLIEKKQCIYVMKRWFICTASSLMLLIPQRSARICEEKRQHETCP